MARKPTYEDLAKRVQDLERAESDREQAEAALKKKTHDLGERVKELKCLYGISHLVEAEMDLPQILQGTVDLIPESWQYPVVTMAEISFEDKKYGTCCRGNPCKENPPAFMSQPIIVKGHPAGKIRVCYLEEKPESDEGPFLREERDLINAIAERLGRVVEHKHAEKALRKAHNELEVRVHARTIALAKANKELRGEIADRKRAKEKLREREARLGTIIDKAPVMINSFNESGKCLQWNEDCVKRLGWTLDEINRVDNPMSLFYPDPADQERVLASMKRADGKFREYKVRAKDGTQLTQAWADFRLPDGSLISIGHDITKRKQAEETIKASLKEKDVLLREIHHRVKNNMQVIVSLLRMHARRSGSDRMRSIFDDCQNRINAMSLIHETLYQSKDLARIDFKSYLRKLCRNLSQAHGVTGKGIVVKVARCNVKLGVDQGIAVGMVISELVSNAFKHAFSPGKGGNVSVSMVGLDGQEVALIVQDNGKGLPPAIDIHNPPSLGLQLTVATVKRDLGGSMTVERDGGSRFIIRFRGKSA